MRRFTTRALANARAGLTEVIRRIRQHAREVVLIATGHCLGSLAFAIVQRMGVL